MAAAPPRKMGPPPGTGIAQGLVARKKTPVPIPSASPRVKGPPTMRALAAIFLAGFVACACDSAPDDSTETATQSLTTCRPGFHRVCEPNEQGPPVCACERDDPPPPPPAPLCGTEGHVSCPGACVSRLTLTPSGICSRC